MKLLLIVLILIPTKASTGCGNANALQQLTKDAKAIEKKTIEQQTKERQEIIFNKLGTFKTMEEYRNYVAKLSNQD